MIFLHLANMLTYEKVITTLMEKFSQDMRKVVEASEPATLQQNKIREHLLNDGIYRIINDTKSTGFAVGMKTALMELCNQYYDLGMFRTDVMGRVDADKVFNNVCGRPIVALKSEYLAAAEYKDKFIQEMTASFNTEILSIASALSNVYGDIAKKLEEARDEAEETHEGGLLAIFNQVKDKENLKAEIRAAQEAVSEDIMREKFDEFMRLVPLVFASYFHNIMAAGRVFFEASSSKVKDKASSDETILDNQEKYINDINLYKKAIETKSFNA